MQETWGVIFLGSISLYTNRQEYKQWDYTKVCWRKDTRRKRMNLIRFPESTQMSNTNKVNFHWFSVRLRFLFTTPHRYNHKVQWTANCVEVIINGQILFTFNTLEESGSTFIYFTNPLRDNTLTSKSKVQNKLQMWSQKCSVSNSILQHTEPSFWPVKNVQPYMDMIGGCSLVEH